MARWGSWDEKYMKSAACKVSPRTQRRTRADILILFVGSTDDFRLRLCVSPANPRALRPDQRAPPLASTLLPAPHVAANTSSSMPRIFVSSRGGGASPWLLLTEEEHAVRAVTALLKFVVTSLEEKMFGDFFISGKWRQIRVS